MAVVAALLALQAVLHLISLEAFRVAPSGRAAAGGRYRTFFAERSNNGPVSDSSAVGVVGWHGRSPSLLRMSSSDSSESLDTSYSADNSEMDDSGVEADYNRHDAFGYSTPADLGSSMYLLLRVFESSRLREEGELHELLRRYLTSLVQEGFFNIRVYRESAGGTPPLFMVDFNSFKAYDFVRAQLLSRDPSASEILNTFYFHISRYNPPTDSYASRPRSYFRVPRYGRRSSSFSPRRMQRRLFFGSSRYEREMVPQYQLPPPRVTALYQPSPPPQMIPMHMPPMLHAPPSPYMG
ncbi:hypothetical protein, conserved [Babesia bigemina]|uniref:Uncharacterized protein n=1 Tax=Babesia bigemina TaxID=5866 RepID=A0A061D1Q1_BABBI|nr:hypothetical protein, conserved [Babesia bigemina]CDR94062.1 hypothetical protein, conserved [Babesia bigemina]|eukprot:XP_012766248.1 hypothetical protein, conserved [Babesia bigemina]